MKTTKQLTVTLTIETDSDDIHAMESAICSELAGMEIEYECVEALPDGTDGETESFSGRIAIAKTEKCRVDAGVSKGYTHPDAAAAKNKASVGGRQIVYG